MTTDEGESSAMSGDAPAVPAARLAEHVLGLAASDVPVATREKAVTLILDALGNGLFGAAQRGPGLVRERARARFRDGGALVWADGSRLDPAGAATANAAGAHGFELDDYLPAGKTHAGAVILPVALAVAGDDTSGEELVTAVVAAYDVVGRVSLAMDAASARARGWHVTGLTGPFGAAAVAGRLLGLDPGRLVSAFGVAASCAAGTFAFSAEGAMTKCLHAARAAEAGIEAVRLAAAGFVGPTHGLDAEDGGILRAVSDTPLLDRLTAELGTRFDVDGIAVKPYACCGSIHSSIDAVLAMRDAGLRAEDVAEIVVGNSSSVLLQCGFDYHGDGGALEAQMSMQYSLAAALVDGAVGVAQFEDRRRRDPDLLALARLVRFEVDPEIDAVYPQQFPARVQVRRRSGELLDERVAAPLGMPERPLGRVEVTAKFRDLTAGLIDDGGRRRIEAAVESLDGPAPAADLVAAIASAVGSGVAR
jgi:2-methylcitrate dehydratase PrpD